LKHLSVATTQALTSLKLIWAHMQRAVATTVAWLVLTIMAPSFSHSLVDGCKAKTQNHSHLLRWWAVLLVGSAGASPTFFVAKHLKFSLKTRRKKQSGGTKNVQIVDSPTTTSQSKHRHITTIRLETCVFCTRFSCISH
jgi:hypothetical protein